jgi:hypothetical protein
MAHVCVKIMQVFVKLSLELPWSEYLNQKYKDQWLQNHICLKLPVFVVICLKHLDNFTRTCMILTQTWAIGRLLNSHTVKHANCYGSSHYFLKILFINHTYKIQLNKGKAWHITSPKNLTWWPWPLTLKINRVPDSLKD